LIVPYFVDFKMEIIDNISSLLGDDLKTVLRPSVKLKIAASCFSMYAYEALKTELEQIDSLNFIFTSPTFIPNQVTDKLHKEKREFHIPKLKRENSLYGSEFEIRLKNELTQRAIAKECAEWIQRKVLFRSNSSDTPMQQFACVEDDQAKIGYLPLTGFTAVDLGYQKGDAVSNIGIINKLESYNGCILADSVGLGKTFTALAVIKYYELRNKSVLVLCPKKIADNWQNYNQNLVTNIFAKDRFNYTVLCHTDLQRNRGYSLGIPLDRINWGNFDLVVIDESHNFRNNEAFKDRETRYQKLMNKVIKAGVKTKVLMLSATPVNDRFNDLRNQLALAYEGESDKLDKKLHTEKDINEIFRSAQGVFNIWAKLPPQERTPAAILNSLSFDFFEMLDSVTIARSRKHIQKFYDIKDIGPFPERLKPISYHCPLTHRTDVINFNEIFNRLIILNMAMYAPFRYILASRLGKYEALYDTEVKGGLSRLKQSDREKSLQALMTVNLLKRLESSVEAFRLTLQMLHDKHENADEDEMEAPDSDATIGGKVQISLADMDLDSWEFDLSNDLEILSELLREMKKITASDDAKLQCLKDLIARKQAEPINPDNKKILIFTAFADTAGYLYDNLTSYIKNRFNLHTAIVTGSDGRERKYRRWYREWLSWRLYEPKKFNHKTYEKDRGGTLCLIVFSLF